ncbi:hypothetical protein HPT29_021595 [Microvirga terrae]|uniref:Uncharacterized protein n=1 Tax=Microvirga terrae TaxID=2740529 RepID=A0ABY5RTA0_9HYPH|nr:hypothetical protein [Microvirga terrae]UVF19027.1 hypothetical protein HPT29_021595 [Microvirga terrae]
MRSKTSKAWGRARTAAIFKAKAEVMAGKADDRAQGLAERSLNASIVPPTEENSVHRSRDDRSASDRRLDENDQREGLEQADPATSTADSRSTP